MKKSDEIRQSAELAKQAMIANRYDEAYQHINKVPGEYGVKLYLLILEHEISYIRENGGTI